MEYFAQWKTAAEAVCATFALLAVVIASPFVIAKGRLVQERDAARADATRLEGVLTAISNGTKGLQSIADEVGRLREEVAAARNEIEELRATQIVSTRYIGQLIEHIREGGIEKNMPAIPREISDDVLTQIRARESQRVTVGAT